MSGYTEQDVVLNKGFAAVTRDGKYRLVNDGTDHAYWQELYGSSWIQMGHTSYDYVYPTRDKAYYAKKLNFVISRL